MPLFDRFKSMLAGGRLHVSGRFVLLHEAISGTMSSFYMARDMHSGQVVGLKILDPREDGRLPKAFQGIE